MADLERIAVRRYGDAGPAVVVLHGGPGAPGSLARLAVDLSAAAKVLEPLQRRSGIVPLTVDQHVADLAAVLRETFEGPIRVIGHSWGAMFGLSFAATHPELVDRLAIVGVGTYDEESRATHDRTLAENLGVEGRDRKARLKAEMAAAPGDDLDRLLAERARLSALAQAYELVPDALDPADTDLPVDAVGHEQTWTDVLRRQREHVDPESFTAIRCPVLMVHGDADPHPGPSTFRTLSLHIPDVTYEELERCGHSPWLERHARDRFLAVLQAWMR